MFKLPYLANQIIVTTDMCDHNDHMNVNYYYKMFDEVYSKLYFEELDFSPEYVASGFSTFTLEDNIRYLKEFRLGDKIYPSFLLNNANEKMLHFVGILLNENNELAAIFETVLGHINLNERKMVPFSDDRLKNILEYKERTKLDQDLPFELKLKIRDL
ncbi:thioesterase family protein [Gammaproteobacteria bacterium]|nr:thioesterase family protein [Gammaproteobacteria bacterium]MDA8998932.1 thioesterase family protein [Gammaproteobacteria bacterium]MDA9578012.1 thioesterase family protein [Gammaproteobacteria bacterium]MDC0990910.1 thioesterase family protein [Gammaproteobacteria bacterium]